ncbi:MAG: preprotein translocase subunit SecD, partial [Marinobacter sp.]|nr:preprotein translocase subunit SecD [Marinobacter sp.]
MLNKYPLWKNLIILIAIAIGFIYALPNLYPDDYAVQITGARSSTDVGQRTLDSAVAAVKAAGIEVKGSELGQRNGLIRVNSAEAQLKARPIVQSALGQDYLVAINMAPSTPDWLRSIGAGPMKLGLDLRGGVHFLLEVDMDTALKQRLDAFSSQIKRELRDEHIRYRGGDVSGKKTISLSFRDDQARSEAFDLIKRQHNEFLLDKQRGDKGEYNLVLTLTEKQVKQLQDYAIEQNLTTLRNRVNELGVAEPLVQRQGASRIVVELPGVQDTAQAKRVIGATANLEFRMEARADESDSAVEVYPFRNNPQRTARLERDVIVTGDSVANAQQAFDQNGQPQVNITMNAAGGDLMNRATRNAIGRRMAVLFIEYKTQTEEKQVDGKTQSVDKRTVERSIISLATVQSALGSSFRITGLDSVNEASELALLLRAGSLAAPMYFAEERTIGP